MVTPLASIPTCNTKSPPIECKMILILIDILICTGETEWCAGKAPSSPRKEKRDEGPA